MPCNSGIFCMKFYWVKTHPLIRKAFRNYLWKIPTKEKVVYLTFDDGPTPEVTDFVLSELDKYGFKATFFCIGNNVESHPDIFRKVMENGHSVGNHTYNHVNGWHVPFDDYMDDVEKCADILNSHGATSTLFRPPYGKLSLKQSKRLRAEGFKIVMWDILSADFDTAITPERCLNNVVKHISPGSIIIFHDSVKAFPNLKFALPATLKVLKEKGYRSAAL